MKVSKKIYRIHFFHLKKKKEKKSFRENWIWKFARCRASNVQSHFSGTLKNVSFYSIFFILYRVKLYNYINYINLKFSNRHPIVICIIISRTPCIPRSLKKLIERDCRWWPARDRLASSKQAKRFLKRFIRSPVNRWSIYFRRSSCEQNIMGRDVCPSPLQAWPAAGVFVSCLTRNGIRPSDQSFQELTSPGWRRSPRFPVVASSDEQLFSSRPAQAALQKLVFPFHCVGAPRALPLTAHGIKLDRCPIYLLAPFF